jgi:Tol biopolymer transport system component
MLLSNAAVPFLRNEPVSNSACAQTGSDWTIRQLTINGGSWPAISGDGSKVAFISRANTKSVVSVINSDGIGFKQLTNLESRFPSISGDGSKIVFSAIYNETSFGLCIIDSDGSGLRELVHLRNTAFSSISYDGSKIAFMVYLNPMELYVINSDGTGLRQLASGMLLYAPGENACSIITANGSKIVFYAFVDSNSDSKPDSLDIYTVNSDGTGLNRLTTGLHATYPSISNDGRRIAFREGESIYIMNSDGTGLTQISSAGEWPSISGDGSTVAVQGRMNGSITIFTVSIDGGSVKQIVNTGTNLYPAVNYDGSRIVFLSSFGGL